MCTLSMSSGMPPSSSSAPPEAMPSPPQAPRPPQEGSGHMDYWIIYSRQIKNARKFACCSRCLVTPIKKSANPHPFIITHFLSRKASTYMQTRDKKVEGMIILYGKRLQHAIYIAYIQISIPVARLQSLTATEVHIAMKDQAECEQVNGLKLLSCVLSHNWHNSCVDPAATVLCQWLQIGLGL